MKQFFILLTAAALIASCEKVGKEDCTPATFEFNYSFQKKIDTVRLAVTDPQFVFYNYNVIAGDQNVFTYKHTFQDCPEIADDEGSLTVVFEAAPLVNSFLIKDSAQMVAAKCLVHLSCLCSPGKPLFIKKGTIEGTRINNTSWSVKMDLSMPWNENSKVSFEKTFELK